MTDSSSSGSPAPGSAAAPTSTAVPSKRNWFVRGLFVIGGMVLGALVGMAVQAGVSTTGVLGPGMDQLIAEQNAGFAKIEAKMEALRSSTDPAQVKTMTAELNTLLADQKALAERTHDELRGARAEIDRLREQALEATGAAGGGSNVWLKPGESVNIGSSAAGGAPTSLALVNFSGRSAGTRTTNVVLNAGGETKTIGVGEFMQIKAGGGSYRVTYMNTTPRADGRVGLQVVKE